MAFEYRNPTTGDRVAAVEFDGDVWLKTTSKGCLVPPDRVEEVIAGIRDAARTASGQQPECAPCGDTGACNGGPCAHPAAAPWTADGRHGPTPAEMRQAVARAIHRYDNHHALSGNDIPSEHHYGEADAVLAVLAASAVGQPAEAHATDRPAVLAEAIEAAEGELLQDDTGSSDDEAYNRGVHDAVVAIKRLTVEDER